jgi:Tol biopolymer transport system component
LENNQRQFYGWVLLDFNRNISGRMVGQYAGISSDLFSSDGEYILVTSFTEPEHQCLWSVYSWGEDKVENYPISTTCYPIAPRWSPNNRFIVFSMNLPLDKNIYILSLKSGQITQVYEDSKANANENWVWSPDGKLLALLRISPGTGSGSTAIPTRFNGLQFIRVNCEEDCQPTTDIVATLQYPVMRASWSPDQNHMAFVSKGYGLAAKLYVWDTACLAEKMPDCTLQPNQLREIVMGKAQIYDDLDPIWSPDGQYLMFDAAINRHIGFYRIPSNCYDDVGRCKPDLLLDFDKAVPERMQ